MFKKQTTEFDFGQTSIENIFINDFMPMGNGTHVKVYLLGYKFANDKEQIAEANNHTIARHLNLSLEDVLDAWDFWEKKAIIKKHSKSDNKNDYDIEFLSIRQLYLTNNYVSQHQLSSGGYQRKAAYSNEELLNRRKDPTIREMFHKIDKILQRQLFPNSHRAILELMEELNFDAELIVYGFEYCADMNKRDLRYVLSVLRAWHDQELLTVEKVEEHLEKRSERFIGYKKIYRYMGYQSKMPSAGDKEIIDKWFDDYKLDLDFILFVIKESSKKTSNINMNYMNAIITNLVSEGIRTVEGYLTKQQKPSTEQKTSGNQKKTAPKTQTKNRFHNFEQSTYRYTNEELEKKLGIKK